LTRVKDNVSCLSICTLNVHFTLFVVQAIFKGMV
jgi:hypothetical protein